VPWTWLERLAQSRSANTYRVAVTLLYLHWKANGGPIKLANGMLAMDGVSRWSKQRALDELEQFALITINRRQRKSPIVDPVKVPGALLHQSGALVRRCTSAGAQTHQILPNLVRRRSYGV
jgi:hypothetical protein